MCWLRTAVLGILGLFVDDATFAASILVWVMLVVLLLRHAHIRAEFKGPILGIGLAAILVESATRRARK